MNHNLRIYLFKSHSMPMGQDACYSTGLIVFDLVYVCSHASLFGSDSHGIGGYIAGRPRIKLKLAIDAGSNAESAL